MGTQRTQAGFTIVEVMLVLAITGLMLIGVFAGASAQIAIQRYRDSVNSYQATLKEEFSNVLYTSNDRDGRQLCRNGAGNVPVIDEGTQGRGTSKCLVAGRYLTTSDDGTQLTMRPVLAYQTTRDDPELSDQENLAHYRFSLVDSADSYTLNWGSRIGGTGSSTGNMPFTLAVLRSPTSGSLMTFKVNSANAPIASVVGSPLTQNFDMCVRNDAGIFISTPLAVRINANARSGSAVEVPSESDGICT